MENFVNLWEPPDADPHVRWCERSGTCRPLLLDGKAGELSTRNGNCSKGLLSGEMSGVIISAGRQFFDTIGAKMLDSPIGGRSIFF